MEFMYPNKIQMVPTKLQLKNKFAVHPADGP